MHELDIESVRSAPNTRIPPYKEEEMGDRQQQMKQTPGIYKRRVGDALVTTVNDGYLDIPLEALRGAALGEMQSAMRDAFRSLPPRLTVNAFVIETAGRTILIDAGGGTNLVHSMGLLCDNLEAAGFTPADVDTVLLTHIHPDHSNGLLGPSGERVFTRAEVVVNAADIAFWSEPGLRDGRFAAAMPFIDSASALLSVYRHQLRPRDAGEVAPGITLLPLPGHTPGHSGYHVESAGESLVIWGDTVHVPEIQVPHPQVTSEYDIDESLAAESRRRLFHLVATERMLVAGTHLHVPAFAHLVLNGGAYQLVPEAWSVVV
jgi:glyoxylase-like metal-dependent hydrolase (beta-lactamase superfamily II)